jgi:hypothetical protein
MTLPLACLLLSAGPRLAAQACSDAFYRWTEKTDLALAETTAKRTSITAMLRWEAPEVYAGSAFKCVDRADRELAVFSVIGYVRRIRRETGAGDDGDWHIELTSRRNGDPATCVIVEIPDPQYGATYQQARADFTTLLGGVTPDASGDFAEPVRMRFIGAAFFDGQHRGARGTANPPHQHGRCNSSTAALWELHPVYWVREP